MENKKPNNKNLTRFIFIEIGIVAAITLFWWFGGDPTALYLSNLLFLGGIAVMAIGLLIMIGTRGITGSFNYQFASTVSPDPNHEHVTRDWKEYFYNQARILLFVLYGLPPILLGVLVYWLWA